MLTSYTFDIWIGLVTLTICLIMITTVVFGYRQRNEIVVVPIGIVFAFTQLRSTMPGAPEGFWYVDVFLYKASNLASTPGDVLGTSCFILMAFNWVTYFWRRFCWATTMSRPSVDLCTYIDCFYSSVPCCSYDRPWQWLASMYSPTRMIRLVKLSPGTN